VRDAYIAASGGFATVAFAIGMSVWRAYQLQTSTCTRQRPSRAPPGQPGSQPDITIFVTCEREGLTAAIVDANIGTALAPVLADVSDADLSQVADAAQSRGAGLALSDAVLLDRARVLVTATALWGHRIVSFGLVGSC
jgi:hypothetical protein